MDPCHVLGAEELRGSLDKELLPLMSFMNVESVSAVKKHG